MFVMSIREIHIVEIVLHRTIGGLVSLRKSLLAMLMIFQFNCAFLSVCFGQQTDDETEFKIGLFSPLSCMTRIEGGCEIPYETTELDGFKTSVLNVLAEDGFNIYQTYAPYEWNSECFMKHYLKLSQANGFKVQLGSGFYYKPSVDANGNVLGYGTNVFDNCGNTIDTCETPYSRGFFRPDMVSFMRNVGVVSPYKEIIWGYLVCEEASYFHCHHFAYDCRGNVWCDSSCFKNVELPLDNVHSAISYFKNNLYSAGVSSHKVVVMEANHHKNINDNTNDSEGVYNPQQYIKLLDKNDKRDVFFEGSYTQFPSVDWISQNYNEMFNDGYHYLGPFKSIDYASSYTSEIHKVINIEGTSVNQDYWACFHSDSAIKNANWLWFQTYTSIIHGVKGVWFWSLDFAWNKGELKKWDDLTVHNRYERGFFPENYRKYVANLARELRFLADKGILNVDASAIISEKTDDVDLNCIVPLASSYIPSSLPPEKKTEKYGLRYTIRSNGDETYMIISNPLNVSVSAILDFSNTSNQQIQNAVGVTVLFDNNQYEVESVYYKTDRNSHIDFQSGNVGDQYEVSFSEGKKLSISFGPMDVKVMKFISTFSGYNNGWSKVWSNYGNGKMDGHIIKENDLFYVGDYDGDGVEELLCVGYSKSGTNDWMSLLKFRNEKWEWIWSNYGESSAGNGLYLYRSSFVIGDYDGDGKDELLGNDIEGWTTMFKFENGNWQWIWSDYGNASHTMRSYKDIFYAGDYDGDGKEELLGCDLPSGWTTLFKWNGNDFVWNRSDYGNNHPIRQYRDQMVIGDFDGDEKSELIGFDTSVALFDLDGVDWSIGWTSNGASDFGGWTYPMMSTDTLLVGNLDSDNKDELLIVQTHSTAAWATSMDLKNDRSGWNWNWSANPQYGFQYIDDWPLSANGGENTRYILITVMENAPKYLIAMRQYCNSFLVNMYKTSGYGSYK